MGNTVVVNTRDTIEQLENADRSTNGLHELREDGQQGLEGKHRLKQKEMSAPIHRRKVFPTEIYLKRKEHVADQVSSCDHSSENHLSTIPENRLVTHSNADSDSETLPQ